MWRRRSLVSIKIRVEKLKKPYIIVGGLMSVDGKTAPRNRRGMLLTHFMGEELSKRLHKLRAEVDAVVVGIGTVLADNPRLTVRFVEGKNPTRVIVDSEARIPLNSAVLNVEEAKTVVVTSEEASKEKLDALGKMGVEVIRCGKNKVNIKKMLESLREKGVNRLLVEGGAELRWSFFREGVVDEVLVWIAPVVWGGREAPTFVDGEGFKSLDEAIRLKLKNVEVVEEVVTLRFDVCQTKKS
jgi:2,5-diamino-6-(ribosylamino)-4(3H)-pyrimidinone 5'-phosphate reductase